MDESKQDEKRYPRISGEEFDRNPSEIMRLAEREGGVYLTNEQGADSAFICVPMDALPPFDDFDDR